MSEESVTYQVTVRFGSPRYRYHRLTVDAPGLPRAMAIAASQLPPEVGESADLVEIRVAVDPDGRAYL